MIPAGYMAKMIANNPGWVSATANIVDIYSVSGCASHHFADYIKFWKHNGYWLFDAPNIIRQLADDEGIDLSPAKFFYYEVYPQQYDEERRGWSTFSPETSFSTNVRSPEERNLEGYDVVSFSAHTSPECSPLSCNNAAKNITVNEHCLLRTFEEAKSLLELGAFDKGEPGPFRIFAVYSVPPIQI
jgi:hypothetical protein